MFASPAIRVFSQENAGTVPKKPGVTNSLSRKPFIDRTVNGTSPDPSRNLKPDCFKKTDFKPEKELGCAKTTPEDDLFFYDSYSYKDIEDNYLDIKCLTQKDTLNILRSYCKYTRTKSPVPELPTDFEMFVDIPATNMYFKCDDSFENKLLEESLEDVSVPSVDFDGLD